MGLGDPQSPPTFWTGLSPQEFLMLWHFIIIIVVVVVVVVVIKIISVA